MQNPPTGTILTIQLQEKIIYTNKLPEKRKIDKTNNNMDMFAEVTFINEDKMIPNEFHIKYR